MEDRLPWPRRTAVAALGFLGLVWLLSLALLGLGSPIGGLLAAIATWLTAGLLHSAGRNSEEVS